ncbi:hypothetical protein WB334_23045 [Escherichia coli]|uniref:hypothetical protein n=1 Tax=Escherichia coli TaxID=562 RepID=UPI0020301438|nr:hypothetical protein [Escherichia coli]MCR8525780.1 hypothetical protein [Escherichia coli]MDQ8104144.1 hypothetical protein [Escherichia coli]WFY89086.1 hypothetical protein NFK45_06975 [Escherichia coli]
MTYLLRKISHSKWECNKGRAPDNISADAITGCTRTSNNTLSVWVSDSIDFQDESVEKIIVALATTMSEPATIDLVWLDSQWFEDKGINISRTEGNTLYKSVNHLHRDLSELNHRKLAEVGEHILEQLKSKDYYKRILKSELIALVFKWQQRDGDFDIDDLGQKWSKSLNKLIN